MHKSDMEAALSWCLVDYNHAHGDVTVAITFAHDRSLIRDHLDPERSYPSPIQLDQICHLSQIYETGEEFKYQPRIEWVQYFNNLLAKMSAETIPPSIHKMSTSQFTRKQLMQRPDFSEWQAAELNSNSWIPTTVITCLVIHVHARLMPFCYVRYGLIT